MQSINWKHLWVLLNMVDVAYNMWTAESHEYYFMIDSGKICSYSRTPGVSPIFPYIELPKPNWSFFITRGIIKTRCRCVLGWRKSWQDLYWLLTRQRHHPTRGVACHAGYTPLAFGGRVWRTETRASIEKSLYLDAPGRVLRILCARAVRWSAE